MTLKVDSHPNLSLLLVKHQLKGDFKEPSDYFITFFCVTFALS